MTAYPVDDNAGHWWLCCGKWRRLHAIRAASITPDAMDTAMDDNTPVPARSACGLRRGWSMPGLFSRLGLRRCTPCCTALGIPPGPGTPANQNYRETKEPR